ncbi:L-aspartate oxidase [Psychrobacter fozii]|uniref:L-aspartate oxidase n=1 Tax=Psychrobacter fozii TaxID=198480 RepID=A0A2V4V5K9_9GAMM|nr:L-aspartate oxidase [Psychrobacter fozii]PYE40100.1 L-aspartate oxidase [Psychrobacter fozii]
MSADNVRRTDVLIIGAGLAGLSTALSLPKSLSIMVLSKAALEVCSSHYAQGGIAASLDKNDSVTDHVADTLIAGAGLCDANNTTEILSEGQQAIQWLCEQGVPFTQNTQQDTKQKTLTDLNSTDLNTSDLEISNLHLTKEGGHGCRRVAHADDATGRHVMEALIIKAHAASNITILPYHEALSLLKGNRDNHCQGARVFDHKSHRQLTVYSRAVVLASGGLGQLFQRASAPNVCVGDGVMMAWQAGCRLANLEFIQFHPTGLALDDSSFLISEALRGEGGRLYCPQTGRRFMLDVDERAELAPRDIVARAIAEQINVNGLGYVHLDVSHLPAPFLQEHFPQIYQTLLTLGIDITTDPIPVAPTAHYSCGGVVTSVNGMTDIVGLYAAGEVAYTGLHGANRLASNSLLECVVVGRNIAADLPRYLTEIEVLDAELHTSAYRHNLNVSANDIWKTPILKNTQTITLPYFTSSTSNLYDYHEASKHCHSDADMTEIIIKLKALMTANMGITRSAKELEEALKQIQKWQKWLKKPELSSLNSNDSDSNINRKNSAVSIDELTHLQLERQLQLATLIVQSAYQRIESRGGHYRTDYPNLAVTPQTSVINPLLDTREGSIDWLIQPIIVHSGARAIKATTAT